MFSPRTRQRNISFGVLFLFLVTSSSSAAETGDFDGDGRLSIGDVVHSQENRSPAPGSLDGFEVYPCSDSWRFPNQERSGITYLESLRRAVPDSLPHWIPIWPHSVDVPPLPTDDRVELRWDGGVIRQGQNRVLLDLTLFTDVEIRAFSILVESEGQIIRMAPLFDRFVPPSDWTQLYSHTFSSTHSDGDILVGACYPPYLITGGRHVINYGLDTESAPFFGMIQPGVHRIVVEARLPKGAEPGSYAVNLLDTSEILLADGTIVSPEVGPATTLRLTSTVTSGWEEDIPPLQFDLAENKVLGDLELRVSDAEGHPGDLVTVRVEMKAGRPVNHVTAKVSWPAGALLCTTTTSGDHFVNPEDERAYRAYRPPTCINEVLGFSPFHEIEFTLQGAKAGNPNYQNRPFEYFKPLGEWTTLTELVLEIPDDARGGSRIPVTVERPWDEDPVRLGQPIPQYQPYGISWPCFPPEFDEHNWLHETVVVHEGMVTVLGDQGGPPDGETPDLGVRCLLGDATGSPGAVVEIPISVAVEKPPYSLLRLAVAVDPTAVEIESVVFEVLRLQDGSTTFEKLERGDLIFIQDCVDPEVITTCSFGIPFSLRFFDSPPQYGVFDLIASTPDTVVEDYPGDEPQVIGKLRVRIREDYAQSSTVVRLTTIQGADVRLQSDAESGAFLPAPDLRFAPASETKDATIRVILAEKPFRRGDANADGRTDLSDAVATLSYLFMGGESARCLEAADADDTGIVEITDAIYLLANLFLGGPLPPSPSEECGFDPTADSLDCSESPCDEEP